MGKAIIATWPDAAVETLVSRQGLRPMTPTSLRTLDDVLAEVRSIRTNGYAVDNEEYVRGMRCVAAVVWSPGGDPVAAVSASGVASRVTVDRIDTIAGLVMKTAQDLTDELAGTNR